ncbi:MAG: cation-translocating P-type ATPase [Synergistaceae bacterium]|nr:cation-translocating P-type ATPase [Synergistaceae bacterium]
MTDMKRNGSEQENKWNLRISGMTCATCSQIIERALKKIPGVNFASVNLATESAFVLAEPSVTEKELEEAVRASGYETVKDAPADLDELRYREARRNLIQILLIGVPMSLLMFLHMFFGYHFAWYGLIEVIFGAIAIFWCGRKTMRGAWIALRHRHTNMDSLIALSAAAAWTTAVMHIFGFAIPSFGTVGVMIMMLHLTGRYIESHLRDRAAKQVKTLLTLQPREARIMVEGETIMVPIDAVKPGTLVQVNPGERIPLDGVVVEGESGVDEALLTGESLPVTKKSGDDVTGGALNMYGILTVRTTKSGDDSFLAKMLELVREAQGGKTPLQALADRMTLKFVPTVITLAFVSAAAWYFFYPQLHHLIAPIARLLPWPTNLGSPAGAAANSFIATLVIACPCALGLATPLALVVSAGEASKAGLLIRNAEAIQTLKEVDFAILDKTGTITKGEPKVTKWEAPEESLRYIYALESSSGHPLTRAVTEAVGIHLVDGADSVTETPGEGVSGRWNGVEWFVGRPLDRRRWSDASSLAVTLVEVRRDGEPVGYFAITDPIREDSKRAIAELKELGVRPMMATGDAKETAEAIAAEAGIEDIRWELRPDEKLSLVQDAQRQGRRVLMSGDGINDAAALKGSEVGIAMGGGMDLAVDSADIVIMKGGLSRIVAAIKISAKTRRVIKENLFGAFIYNIIAIPLAMAGLLHPIAAELAMAASSITVILNSMRISGSAGNK